MNRYFILILCLFQSIVTCSQDVDSLFRVWKNEQAHDTLRLDAFTKYIVLEYLYSNPDSALILIDDAIEFAHDRNQREFEAKSIKIKGATYYMMSNIPPALENYNKALKINREIGDEVGEASVLNNIGLAYLMRGEFDPALTHFSSSLDLYMKHNELDGKADVLANIAIIYLQQGETKKGLDYYEQSLEILEKVDDKKGIATALANLADTYRDLGEYEKSNEYSLRSLRINQELGDQYGEATALMSIGRDYRSQKQYDEAVQYFERALELREQISDLQGVSSTLTSLASVQDSLGNYYESIDLNLSALEIADSIGARADAQHIMQRLYSTYKTIGEYDKALEMHEMSTELRDSLFNDEKSKELLKKEYAFEANLQHIADSLDRAKEKALSDERDQRRQSQLLFLYIGLGLFVIFSIFIVNRLILSTRQKRLIVEQKTTVEEQHKQIQSSIHYASRIQNALFSNHETWERISVNQFVLFKPRDVVSGDFYWAHEKDNMAIWAAADCTGHGVPGAFMSMLGVSFLNQIVTEGGETRPDIVLNLLREKIIKALEQKGIDAEQKDGMDIALCAWNKKTNVLQYAGAYNPLCLVTANAEKAIRLSNGREISYGSHHLVVIPGSKQPIGQHMKDVRPFQMVEFQLDPGDSLYTFSDGYADQFGGPSGKKFMTKRLYELFLKMQSRPFNQHLSIMDEDIENWMKASNSYQVDDICVVGVRV